MGARPERFPRNLFLGYARGSATVPEGVEEASPDGAEIELVAVDANLSVRTGVADVSIIDDGLGARALGPGVGTGFRLHSTGWRAVKRSTDIVLSLLLIVLTLPLMLLIVLAVLLESGRPAFFVHRRMGKNGREFGLIKFRTMVRDAEAKLEQHLKENPDHLAEWNEKFKLRKDPRVTRVGRILRISSLDELPQLFNILRGEMSLVGPRAIVEREIPRFGDYADVVLSVKPGLTGLWAVSGRSEVARRDRPLLEYEYVRRWNIFLDLWILILTIPAVIRGHGAY